MRNEKKRIKEFTIWSVVFQWIYHLDTIYYIIVIFGYLLFEIIPINYRPILIDGLMEASYPSSTTLLVLSVMPTLWFQAKRRMKNEILLKYVCVFSALFSINVYDDCGQGNFDL